MTQITKDISEEYVVAIDLGTYTDLIETDYKFRLLRDTLMNSLEYCTYKTNNIEINTDKVVPILNAIEPVTYKTVFNQLENQYKEAKNGTKVSEAKISEKLEEE